MGFITWLPWRERDRKLDLQQQLPVVPPVLRSPSLLICNIADWGIYLSLDWILRPKICKFLFQVHDTYDVCALAKQSWLLFSISLISSVKPFELFHYDIWGPYKIPTLFSTKYLLTIVNDYSRFTWIFFMHKKSDAQHLPANFSSFVQTQFNGYISNIQIGNGRKFSSMRDFFK